MPELPEVQLVVNTLSELLMPLAEVTNYSFLRKDIRFVLPDSEFKKWLLSEKSERQLLGISRKAKFILFEFKNCFLISHLGMTGSWRLELKQMPEVLNFLKKHDHVLIEVNGQKTLIYNDPRRFGFLSFVKKADLQGYFKNYGYEPLGMNKSEINNLYLSAQKSTAPIKTFIMNQKYLVGVGNIYACEALYKTQISPFKKTSLIHSTQFAKLILHIQEILKLALQRGGSTIKNYRNAKDEAGQFQTLHQVYDKAGQVCKQCKKNKILRKVQAGRSTFYCSKCQK